MSPSVAIAQSFGKLLLSHYFLAGTCNVFSCVFAKSHFHIFLLVCLLISRSSENRSDTVNNVLMFISAGYWLIWYGVNPRLGTSILGNPISLC